MLLRNTLNNTIIKNKILIIRHGESIWNHDSKFTGWTNIPLTDNGRNEAAKIGNILKYNDLIPSIIFSSVLNRSIETSSIIKKELNRNIEIHTSWRLNEKHYGTLEGIPRNYIRNVYGDKFTKMMRSNFNMKPPILKDIDPNILNKNHFPVYKNCYLKKVKNGESKENVLERLLPYYENDILYTLNDNNLPLIVTHKHCARVLMKHLLKINDDDFEYYQLPDKKIIAIDLDEKLNYKSHDEISY
jgi:2,3-bisphosphoglycerate-dependent phosphoglycerate mutase